MSMSRVAIILATTVVLSIILYNAYNAIAINNNELNDLVSATSKLNNQHMNNLTSATETKDSKGTIDNNYTHKYEPFNTTNPHINSWCPFATCQNSPLCAPCNRRYILILATGRSGSTTLLKMMNFLPNVRLSGENRNFIGVSSALISNFEITDPSQKGNSISPLLSQNYDRSEGAFAHYAIPPQAMSCPIQHALNTLNPPPQNVQLNDHILSIQEYDKNTIFGCKTIRFHKNNFPVKYASKYLKEVFPCSRIIINIRSDVSGQIDSIQSTFKNANLGPNGKNEDDIMKYNQYLKNLGKELGEDMAKVIDLSQWKDDVNVLNDVVDWLGFEGCKFTSLVHENLNGLERDNRTDVGIDEKCRYLF